MPGDVSTLDAQPQRLALVVADHGRARVWPRRNSTESSFAAWLDSEQISVLLPFC